MTRGTELGVKQRRPGVEFWGWKEVEDGRPSSLLELPLGNGEVSGSVS